MSDQAQAQLYPVNDSDLEVVLSWFSNAKEVFYWGGPELSFPMTLSSFKQQSKFDKSHSYVLKAAGQLLAFGQFYNRLGRCHLGRLVVAPDARGQGVGETLITQLNRKGAEVLGLSSGLLFVLDDNEPAMRLYTRIGYRVAEYPKEIPLKSCLYLTKD